MRISVITLLLTVGAAAAALPSRADNCHLTMGLPVLDVAPRNGPDGRLNVSDVIVLSRFAVGLTAPTPQELQRADVAPARTAEGLSGPSVHVMEPDGEVDVADLILALRVTVGLSVLTTTASPSLEFVLPDASCTGPGMTITLVGQNLVLGGHLPEVLVDGLPASVIGHQLRDSRDWLSVRTLGDPRPMLPPGGELVPVSLTTALGEADLDRALRLLPGCAGAPVLVAIEPTDAPSDVAVPVTLSGIGLACSLGVEFDHADSPASETAQLLQVLDDNTIVVLRPALHELGHYDVTVTNACGPATLVEGHEVVPAPDPGEEPIAITGFDPPWAWEHLPTSVRVTGTRLDEVNGISWDGRMLSGSEFIQFADGRFLIHDIPRFDFDPLPYRRNVSVGLHASGLPVPGEWSFALEAACPATCGSLAPASGSLAGGTRVVITPPWSSELRWVDEVRFGGRPARDLELVVGFQLELTTPSALDTGPVTVELFEGGEVVATCETAYEYR